MNLETGALGIKPAACHEQRWSEISGEPDERINLAEAALTFASAEYPGLDIARYLGLVNEMGARLRARLREDMAPAERILALNRYLFGELGFAGNAAEYYDPRNSYLNEVLDRRLGIPITLSVVYLEVGRRIGLPLHGVAFPGHFLVKCAVRDGAIVLDPYAKGASLGVDDLRARLRVLRNGIEPDADQIRMMLTVASNKEILARMLRNLKAIYLQQKELEKAVTITGRIIALAPQAPEEYRDRGRIYLELECFRAALADFQSYLLLKPDADDAIVVRQKAAELHHIAARLN
jgi:regulator of sirC expression with transglutaminase-like and TPR domain